MDLKYGVVTINEVRQARGLDPVPWGNVPWLSTRQAPADQPRNAGVAGQSEGNDQ